VRHPSSHNAAATTAPVALPCLYGTEKFLNRLKAVTAKTTLPFALMLFGPYLSYQILYLVQEITHKLNISAISNLNLIRGVKEHHFIKRFPGSAHTSFC
jgi:hypothetical protein